MQSFCWTRGTAGLNADALPQLLPSPVSTPRSSNRTGGFPASGSRRKHHAFWRATPSGAPGHAWELLGSRQSPVPCPFGRSLSTEAPSLRRHYPASPVLRAPPPPRPARPVPRGRPVDPPGHRSGLPVLLLMSVQTCRRQYPGRAEEVMWSLVDVSGGSLPRFCGGSAPALAVSRPAQRSLTLRPACSPIA